MSQSKQETELFDLTNSSGETHYMNVTKDYANDMRRFLTSKDTSNVARTNKKNFNFYKPLLAGRKATERALIYASSGKMDLLIDLITQQTVLFFEKYPEIKAPSGQIYFDLSPYQLMFFLRDNGLMTCADGQNIKIMPLIPKEFNEIRQAQYEEMNCGGADLIKLDKNPEELLDFNEVLHFKKTYTVFDGSQQEVTFSLLENPDGIICYQDENNEQYFYYANKESKKIVPLTLCFSSEEDKLALEQLKATFKAMENNSGCRSSDKEHSLIMRVMQCTLVRKGIRYEENGIRYRDSQTPFNNLINAYRMCISLYEKAEQGNNQALWVWDKAHESWGTGVGKGQAKSPLWILQ
jgi:hypothetical protein